MKKLMYLLLTTVIIVGLASCKQQNHVHKIPKGNGGKHGDGGKNNCNCPTWD